MGAKVRGISSPTRASTRSAMWTAIRAFRSRASRSADRDDLDQAATELERLGHAVHVGTREEADARMVRDFIGFSDPTGNRIEIAWRPAVSGIRYHGTRDAGITGFSHIGLCTTDPVRDEAFWTQVCNARVSDRIGDAALLRIDEVHHSIALFPTNRAGIQHINHQVETADDIMRSLHFLKERRVNITFGPGRHPSSSAKFLYFEGPDGMMFEYSSGVRSIADELLYRERQLRFDPKGLLPMGCQASNPRVHVDGGVLLLPNSQPHSGSGWRG